MAAWLAILVLIVSGVVLVGRHDAVTFGGLDAADLAMMASGVLLVVWLSGTYLPLMRESHPRTYRILTRTACLLVLVAVTPLVLQLPWPQLTSAALSRWYPTALPAPAAASGEKAVRIRIRPDGHFYASAHLNGTPVTLLVDSGAAAVMLKASDARDAGIDTAPLHYAVPIETAHGTAYVARVRLRQLSIGVLSVPDVEVLVAQPGKLETSLLGMTFLNRLRSYEIKGAFLTFRG